jgi:hypothetical protein
MAVCLQVRKRERTKRGQARLLQSAIEAAEKLQEQQQAQQQQQQLELTQQQPQQPDLLRSILEVRVGWGSAGREARHRAGGSQKAVASPARVSSLRTAPAHAPAPPRLCPHPHMGVPSTAAPDTRACHTRAPQVLGVPPPQPSGPSPFAPHEAAGPLPHPALLAVTGDAEPLGARAPSASPAPTPGVSPAPQLGFPPPSAVLPAAMGGTPYVSGPAAAVLSGKRTRQPSATARAAAASAAAEAAAAAADEALSPPSKRARTLRAAAVAAAAAMALPGLPEPPADVVVGMEGGEAPQQGLLGRGARRARQSGSGAAARASAEGGSLDAGADGLGELRCDMPLARHPPARPGWGPNPQLMKQVTN